MSQCRCVVGTLRCVAETRRKSGVCLMCGDPGKPKCYNRTLAKKTK